MRSEATVGTANHGPTWTPIDSFRALFSWSFLYRKWHNNMCGWWLSEIIDKIWRNTSRRERETNENTSTSQLEKTVPLRVAPVADSAATPTTHTRFGRSRCKRPIWSATKSRVPLKTTVTGRGGRGGHKCAVKKKNTGIKKNAARIILEHSFQHNSRAEDITHKKPQANSPKLTSCYCY